MGKKPNYLRAHGKKINTSSQYLVLVETNKCLTL